MGIRLNEVNFKAYKHAFEETRKSEIQIQAEVFQYFWNKYPQTRYCLFHVPNEGKRTVMNQKQLEASGFIPGIQDLHFVWFGQTYLIELKSETGDIRPSQKVVHAAHARVGMKTFVFYDAKSCIEFIEFILNNYNEVTNIYEYIAAHFKDFVSVYSQGNLLELYEAQYVEWKRKQRKYWK